MSLSLLKHVWRNLVKSNQLSLTSLHSRTFASSLSEVTLGKTVSSVDPLTSRLQAAGSVGDVLATVQAGLPGATAQHLLQALRCLFTLHRNGRFEKNPEELIQDPGFSVLCQNFKKHARALDINETIEATKVLSYLGVPVDSLIVQTMLQLIRCNINNVNVRQIMFLDFILSRYETKNHLVDALRLALPLAFQVHLPLEMDNDDLPLLRDMLNYCCSHNLPDRCINNVVTGLLLHDQTIDAQCARSIIWSLCGVNCTEERFPTRVQLLHICCDILTQSISRLSYDEVLRTAARLKGRILEKHPEYYHEHLMDAIASYVVENDVEFEKALLIGRVLSRLAHTHLGLVEHLCALAASSPQALQNARTNILFGFINCLANNNYTPQPEQWAEIKQQISNNPILDSNAALPWVKVCLELASLGHYDDRLLRRVFSQEFLDEFLSRRDNVLDHLQLLTLHEAVHTFHSQEYSLPPDVLRKARALYPRHGLSAQLQAALARALRDPGAVARDVLLPSGIVADVFVCLQHGFPVRLPAPAADGALAVEALGLPPGSLPVCILNFSEGCFSMNSSRLRGTFQLVLDVLEAQGYACVGVNLRAWLRAPPHERAPYLLQELAHRVAQCGVKLAHTAP